MTANCCYYLTTNNSRLKKQNLPHFATLNDVIKYYNYRKPSNHLPIWLRWNDSFETPHEKEKPIE